MTIQPVKTKGTFRTKGLQCTIGRPVGPVNDLCLIQSHRMGHRKYAQSLLGLWKTNHTPKWTKQHQPQILSERGGRIVDSTLNALSGAASCKQKLAGHQQANHF